MALSFTTAWDLVNISIGAGDIAVIAGVGRSVGTWLMAQHEDAGWLSLLNITSDDILQRRGLIDTTNLHRRWDNELTLLENGKPKKIRHPSGNGALVESMDRFTWFMTLVVAALDAVFDSQTVRHFVPTLLLTILRDRTNNGEEILVRGLKKHIEGWRTAGCVRGISVAARDTWERLMFEKKHLPGNIPKQDANEAQRLLLWIATGRENRFETSSSDVLCLAQIMASIGCDQLRTTTKVAEACDESHLLAVLNTSSTPILAQLLRPVTSFRRGMRIPLRDPGESVFMWDGDTSEGMERRDIFLKGMQASEDVNLVVARGSDTLYTREDTFLDVFYVVRKNNTASLPRQDRNSYRILKNFFLAPTPGTVDGLNYLVRGWSSANLGILGQWLMDLDPDKDTDEPLRHLEKDVQKHVSELIIFLLGYYYGILMPLINTSQLSHHAAIGSWGWNDMHALRVFRAFNISADIDYDGRFARKDVLKLLGYLFAGADWADQLRYLPNQAVGLVGKLTIVTSSLMGEADSPEKVEKFWLLDIDPSCIPCAQNGVILSGRQEQCASTEPIHSPMEVDVSDTPKPVLKDFTSHIEPDWDHDSQKVLVAYRHDGRIVHRISPFESDLRTLHSWTEPAETTMFKHPRAYPVSLSEFLGGYIVKDQPDWHSGSPRVEQGVVLCHFMPKARTCINAMYPGTAKLCSNNISKTAEWEGCTTIIT